MVVPHSLIDLVQRHVGQTSIPGLIVHKIDHVTDPEPLIYDPFVCLILQGAKRLFVGGTTIDYSATCNLVIATELSAMGQVTSASPEQPLLALALTLNTEKLSDAADSIEGIPNTEPKAFYVGPTSELELDAWTRLVELLDRPSEIPALSPLREKELLYRLLLGPLGKILRQLGSQDSGLSRIRKIMSHIRVHHAETLEVTQLAKLAGMSPTTFHRKFKSVAGLSPLQYQKQIRLHEAKRHLVAQTGNAASVAFQVGYESASQFSREYRRLFGRPPSQDAAVARELTKILPSARNAF